MPDEPPIPASPGEPGESAKMPLDEMRRQEAVRWFEQAEADMKAARDNVGSGNYNWACYMAEQAAEKAVKAVYVFRNLPFRRIHAIAALIAGNPEQRIAGGPELASLGEAAEGLDAVLTSSRYPDAVPTLVSPAAFYSEAQADECIEWAQELVHAARNLLSNT